MKVTIPFQEEMIRRQAKLKVAATNEAESVILGIIAEEPNITIEQMTEKSGFSNSYVRKLLDSLRNKSLLERSGSNKTGSWVVK